MSTVNQTVPADQSGDYVQVTASVASGLISFGSEAVIATGTVVPSRNLQGHVIRSAEPRRYTLSGGNKLYVKADKFGSIVVIVDED